MRKFPKNRLSLPCVIALIALLSYLAIHALAEENSLVEGIAFLASAVALAWFHEWTANKITWLLLSAHRWISALLMMLVLGAESLMHLLNIPHVEGWWIPLLGSGAATAGMWLHKWKKHPTPPAN